MDRTRAELIWRQVYSSARLFRAFLYEDEIFLGTHDGKLICTLPNGLNPLGPYLDPTLASYIISLNDRAQLASYADHIEAEGAQVSHLQLKVDL